MAIRIRMSRCLILIRYDERGARVSWTFGGLNDIASSSSLLLSSRITSTRSIIYRHCSVRRDAKPVYDLVTGAVSLAHDV